MLDLLALELGLYVLDQLPNGIELTDLTLIDVLDGESVVLIRVALCHEVSVDVGQTSRMGGRTCRRFYREYVC